MLDNESLLLVRVVENKVQARSHTPALKLTICRPENDAHIRKRIVGLDRETILLMMGGKELVQCFRSNSWQPYLTNRS